MSLKRPFLVNSLGLSRARYYIASLLFVVLFSTIVLRAVQIQILAPKKLEKLADRQFKSKTTALPSRGIIYDRNNHGLAVSVKVKSLYIRPDTLKGSIPNKGNLKKFIRVLAKIINSDSGELHKKVSTSKNFLWVKRHLSLREEKLINDLSLDSFNDGVGLAEESKRFYPDRELASHVLGTVNIDGQGIEGLELYYDAILGGERVRIQSLKDAMGRSIFHDDKGLLAFRNGQSVVLTLDKAIQYDTEKILRNYALDFGAKAATAIIADVTSGEILALANYPAYNPNFAKNASMESRRNRAITDIFEPGSILKPLLIDEALSQGMSMKTQIYCEKGKFRVADRTISEAETNEKFEWLSLKDIIKLSSNIGAAKIALSLGPKKIWGFLQKIRFSERTGIDLPGEVKGNYISLEEFEKSLKSSVRLANIGFGHGITFTPIQILELYQAIANGGLWSAPRLVQKVLTDTGEVLYSFDKAQSYQIFSAHNAKAMTESLRAVVEEKGTGTRADIFEWPVAGKTGTAQKIDPHTRQYSRTKYIASFVGFAPVKNPKLVAIVILDEPKTKYYAGETAAPAFKDIMTAALLRKNVPPEMDNKQKLAVNNLSALHKMEQDIVATKIKEDEKAKKVQKPEVNELSQIRLPDMRGQSMREVVKVMSQYPLEVELQGSGVLKDQIPSPAQWLNPQDKIRLVFSQ